MIPLRLRRLEEDHFRVRAGHAGIGGDRESRADRLAARVSAIGESAAVRRIARMARHPVETFAVEDQDPTGLLGDEEASRMVTRVRDRSRTRDTAKNPTATRPPVNGNRFPPKGL